MGDQPSMHAPFWHPVSQRVDVEAHVLLLQVPVNVFKFEPSAQMAARLRQSTSEQHALLVIQTDPHALNPLLHAQTCEAEQVPFWHSLLVQHPAVAMQLPLHDFMPSAHTHWLLVQVIPLAQSAAKQQASFAMHLSPHGLNPALQVKPHVPLAHVAVEFVGTGQGMQASPQAVTSSSLLHIPAHEWEPAAHFSVQAEFALMQVPAQAFCPSGQLALHAVPSHRAEPPAGFWHAAQAIPQ